MNPRMNQRRVLLSSFQYGNISRQSETIVFIAGFPDNEVSGWGRLVDLVRVHSDEKKNIQAIFMCLPDYEDNAFPNPWGYTFDETVSLIKSTIDHYVPDKTKKVNLVIHDWGSYMGYLFENKYPERVKAIISLDVGLMKMPSNPKDLFIIILYQWWFAIAYIYSQVVHFSIGQIILLAFNLFVPQMLLPSNDKPPRDLKCVNVTMTYLYYYLWRNYIFNRKNLAIPNMPACPVNFIFGKKKRVMLHSKEFLNELERRPDCSYSAVGAGHWVACDVPDLVYSEMKTFFNL